jgi:two-component system NtrC family response regulator
MIGMGRELMGREPMSRDPKMWVVERLVLKAAACRANVLLVGESGTGKAFIARRIHQASAMAGRGFSTLFCLPEGGVHAEPGWLSRRLEALAAGCGTVHLRGIDLLGHLSQRELLAWLDRREREVEAAPGGRGDFARLIFSSQMDLRPECERGRYLKQLYLRVSVITVEVPPLRQREGDIVSLANHFLSVCAHRECKNIGGLTADAQHLLRHLAWEGNIRELENAMNHAVVMADDGAVLSAGVLRGVIAEANGTSA